MRFALAGFLLLSLAGLAGLARGDAPAEGEVESIGFDGYYRPNAYVPMKLRLRPKVGETRMYKLAIMQEDMDRDHVLYTRPFTLNGNAEGKAIEEKVWVYFLPQPQDLREARSAEEWSNLVKIFLCDQKGNQITQLPIPRGTTLPRDIDMPISFGGTRGTRLILMVKTGQSRPITTVYQYARGVMEDVLFVPISVNDLPESMMGYEAVDAIVWLDADPAELKSDTSAAIEEFVKDGGRLVVCQSARTWQTMQSIENPLRSLLPVEVTGMGEERGLASLRKLGELPPPAKAEDAGKAEKKASDPIWGEIDPWEDTAARRAPIAKATPKTGAIVDQNQEDAEKSPYLARWMYGMGTVIWVAQDFGDPTAQSTGVLRQMGWAKIWDRVFDWRNDTVTADMAAQGAPFAFIGRHYKPLYEQRYGEVNISTDLSRARLEKMEAAGSGFGYVALVVFFFIGYWLIAGPGSYFFLLSQKRAQYSWPAFAGAAVVATFLTVLVVKLIVRGPPELHHETFVRVGPDKEAVAQSDFGLYIKADGSQHIEIKDTLPRRASYLAPFPFHPDQARGSASGFTAYVEYEVPMRERSSMDPLALDVPYRSTIKKFQARWIGQVSGSIDGRVALNGGSCVGRVTNSTGSDLYNVYFIYKALGDDMMIRLGNSGRSVWPKDKMIDLKALYDQSLPPGSNVRDVPGIKGMLNGTWMGTQGVLNDFKNRIDGEAYRDSDRAALLMSIFDRLKPAQSENQPGASNDRFELLRRGGRRLDASGAISCGEMLIFAESAPDAPLPFPIEVNGRKVDGTGVTYYQFILPMDRGAAATQPAAEETHVSAQQPRSLVKMSGDSWEK